MSTRARKIKFRCDNDCKQSGCEGHVLDGTLQDTSDWIVIVDEQDNIVFSGDINKTRAMLDILHSLDYKDSIYFKTLKGFHAEEDFIWSKASLEQSDIRKDK